jgi:hypothetical protein
MIGTKMVDPILESSLKTGLYTFYCDIVAAINVFREIGLFIQNVNQTWSHSGGRLAGSKWRHSEGS